MGLYALNPALKRWAIIETSRVVQAMRQENGGFDATPKIRGPGDLLAD
jgi:hypothetical protein